MNQEVYEFMVLNSMCNFEIRHWIHIYESIAMNSEVYEFMTMNSWFRIYEFIYYEFIGPYEFMVYEFIAMKSYTSKFIYEFILVNDPDEALAASFAEQSHWRASLVVTGTLHWGSSDHHRVMIKMIWAHRAPAVRRRHSLAVAGWAAWMPRPGRPPGAGS